MAALGYDKQPSSRLGLNTSFTLTTASQQTGTFGPQTYQVRVATSSAVTACFFRIGDGSQTATATDSVIGANVVDYENVTPGQRCAVLGGSAAGTVTVTEMS
jgi:hypothetical protein